MRETSKLVEALMEVKAKRELAQAAEKEKVEEDPDLEEARRRIAAASQGVDCQKE